VTGDEQISVWIQCLQEGDGRAAQHIWQNYFEQLVGLARRRLSAMPRRAVDEEDVALSAMNSFFRGAEAGRFPNLEDRDCLWKLLVRITARKAIKHQRRHFADKRGGGLVRGESVFLDESGPEQPAGLDQFLGREPTDAVADMVSDTCTEMIHRLEDETLQRIVMYKLEGFTNEEIARELDCATRTVERKLERIRRKWSREGDLQQ
jgi:RNA polymerase sigma factor (sigma-70 family)